MDSRWYVICAFSYFVFSLNYIQCVEFDVRTTETANKSVMRLYQSIFQDLKLVERGFKKQIKDADAYRKILLTEKPELVERFRDRKW
jgi:hypothetical protein